MAAREPNRVQFLASFPPIMSALRVGEDGMRIQLDVPESEMGNAVRLLTMRKAVLRVTIEVDDGGGRANKGWEPKVT